MSPRMQLTGSDNTKIPICVVQLYVITINGDLDSGAEKWSQQESSP